MANLKSSPKPRYRPGSLETEEKGLMSSPRPKARPEKLVKKEPTVADQTGLATVEARADFDPALSWNPIARLGFKGFDKDTVTEFGKYRNAEGKIVEYDNAFYLPSRMTQEDAERSLREDLVPDEVAMFVQPDSIVADVDVATPRIWSHEMTHRGFDRIIESINEHPEGPSVGAREFKKKYGERAYDLLTKVDNETVTEGFDYLEDKVIASQSAEESVQMRGISGIKDLQRVLKTDPEDRWDNDVRKYEPYLKLMEAAQDILTKSGEPPKSPKYEESMFDKLKIKLGFADGGLADQMDSMLPAADSDTRSTNEYLGKSDDEFNPLEFAKESWESAKERFMDAGITEVDANDPALYNAYLRSVDYLKDTGLAGLELIDAAARVAIGTLGEVVTGDDQTQKRFQRDIYSMPDAFAGMVGTKSISQLDDAIESAVGSGIQAAEKAKDVGYAAYQKAPAVVGDIVGQTRAAFSGDKDFGTTSDVGPRPLSAGFTGDNPPTYISKDEPPFDPDGIYKTKDGVVKFREPIAEFTQRLTMSNSFPSKGMTGAEFLRLLEKNSESIPPSSYKEGLVDKNKRYSREELLDVVTRGSKGLPEPIYYSLADLASVPKYEQYQRQSDVGFKGYPVPTDSYFSIPILTRTSGKTFKATSQHFDPSTTAHVRGSFIDPLVGWNVNSTLTEEFKNIVGKDKPYLLVEEIQSDLLQKGYVKPKDTFDVAFNKAADETMVGSQATFQEVYGDLTNELKSLFKSLDDKNYKFPEEPVRLKQPYASGVLNHPQFKDIKRRDFLAELRAPERGTVDDVSIITFEEIKDYIDIQGVDSSHIYQIFNDIADNANRFGYLNRFESIAFEGPDGKFYDNIVVKVKDPNANNGRYVVDLESPSASKALKDFDEYTKQFGLNHDDLLNKYGDEIDEYYGILEKELKDRKIDKEADTSFVMGLYERYSKFKADEALLGDETNTALPPVRKNKQTVEEALKVLIAKADERGVDKIVIPPAERIAYARGREIDPKDKGDRFYRTYVTDLNKALEDLEKNYPVTVHRNVELPYEDLENLITENQGNAPLFEAANDLMQNNLIEVDGISIPQGTDLELLSNAVDNDIQAIPLNNEEEAILRSFANHNGIDLYEAGMSFNAWLEGQRRYIETLPEFDAIRKSLMNLIPKEGTIIDISKLREQFQVDKPRQFAEGGAVGNMNQQMSFAFEDGGLRDDGMGRDPVSGNEVPSGSMAKEVRDDIPAQLSEGEYVVPADVVRYYGVKFFEDLRNEAKIGLQDMEMNGRIGGEPVPAGGSAQGSDLTPEEMAALQEVMGMADGGFVDVYAQQQSLYQPPNQAMGNSVQMARGGEVRGYAPGGLSADAQQTQNQIYAAGQQAQQAGFTGFPLGSTIFPTQAQIDAGQTTPIVPTISQQPVSYFQPVTLVNTKAPYDIVLATTQEMYNDYISSGYVVSEGSPQEPVSSGDGGTTSSPTESKPAYEDWLASADFNSAEGIEKFVTGISYDPSKSNLDMQTLGATMLAGPMAGIATGLGGAIRGGGLQAISDLRAASLIAKAQGLDELATKIDGQVADIIKDGPGILDFLDNIFATGKQKANAWAKTKGFKTVEEATKTGVTPTTTTTPARNTSTGGGTNGGTNGGTGGGDDKPVWAGAGRIEGASAGNVGNLSGTTTAAKTAEVKKATASVKKGPAASEGATTASTASGGTTAGGANLDTAMGITGLNKGGLMTKGKKKK